MDYFWNKPFYKPKNKICEDFWDEFMAAAKILMALDYHKPKAAKESPEYREPDVYAVFNCLRQAVHGELPYSSNFLKYVDAEVERDLRRERASGGNLNELYE